MNVTGLEQFHQYKSNDETDSGPFQATQSSLHHPALTLTQARATLKRTCGLCQHVPLARQTPVLRDETGAKSAGADLRYGEGGRTLFLVKKRQVRFISSALHFLDWNEMKGGRVNGVTLSGGRFWVGKKMAKVSVTSLGADFGPMHIVRRVQVFDQKIVRDRFAECGQANLRIEFIDRSEEWFQGNDINVDTLLIVVPKLILERRFGATLPHDPKFLGFQSLF
jgi:hypothetical protein